MRHLLEAVLGALLVLTVGHAQAHDLSSGYVELHSVGDDRFVLIRVLPAGMESVPDLDVGVEPACEPYGEIVTISLGDRVRETRRLRCPGGIAGRELVARGLAAAQIDLLARVVGSDGDAQTARLTVSTPSLAIAASPGLYDVASTYFSLGVEHILTGVDHLLFVLALVLLVHGWRRLLATITAFTVAHSITLAAAVLGPLDLPSPPIEALIALSIALVAVEVIRRGDGRPGYTAQRPWIVAFVFGLLHGLAFADALRSVGLPPGAIPAALLFFNLGVEAGQLAFIAAALPALAIVRRVTAGWPGWTWRLTPYAIGSLAMFWMFDRLTAF